MEVAPNAKMPEKRHQGEGSETAPRRMAICRAMGARESDRQRMARRAKEERERAPRRQWMAMRHATNVAQERARRLKGRLDAATRKKVDACAAKYKRRLLRDFFNSRRLAFDRNTMSEAEMLRKFATCRDLHKMAAMVAEFEISIIEGMAEHGSVENYLKGLKTASEFAEAGSQSNSTPIQEEDNMEKAKPGVSGKTDVRASEGVGDEILVEERERARRRQRMAIRHKTNFVEERARRLKSRLDESTRRKVDACAAEWKRRLLRDFFDSRRVAFDRNTMSEKAMLKKIATFEDLAKLVVMVAEFEISIIEGMTGDGSIGNHLKGLNMAAEFAEGGVESDSTLTQKDKDTENAKPGVSDEADVRAFEGDGDGVSTKEAGDANGRGCDERHTDGLSAKLTAVSSALDDLSCFDSGDQGSITSSSLHTTEQYSLDDGGTGSGYDTENTVNTKLGGLDAMDVPASEGSRDEFLAKGGTDGLVRMEVQKAGVDGSFDVELSRRTPSRIRP